MFGDCILAIDAATGKLIWYYQVLHHDLWDYDLLTPPNLITVKKGNKTIDAVAQITKQGFIFVLDRQTGKPLFPVEEKPVAISKMPGEQSWPTQPFPSKPLPLCRQQFDESIITNLSPEAHKYALKEAKKYEWGNIYLPPSMSGTIEIPGFRGAQNGAAPVWTCKQALCMWALMIFPNLVQLVERKENSTGEFNNLNMPEAGKILFDRNCSACHGADLKGNSEFPPLVNIEKRMKPGDAKNVIEKGRGMMPSFNKLNNEEKMRLFLICLKLIVIKNIFLISLIV